MINLKDIMTFIKQNKGFYVGATIAIIGGLSYISVMIQSMEYGWYLPSLFRIALECCISIGLLLMMLHFILNVMDFINKAFEK